ncbi:tetratricopeptide repeat protein [Massilia sp. TWP1-3-3]|uniref:tetratricopeptide repeat protein n=1 Tax=Massilia sp. TWP1-3-3 TaxID=2804573 RepID=UPI003CEC0FF1
MHILTRTLMASLACLLGGRASAPEAPPAPSPSALADLLTDARVAPPSAPATAAGLFAMSGPMLEFFNSKQFQDALHARGPELGLVDALYAKKSLKLEYDDSTTRDAAATFAGRRGNCLSLVIMTAAFAKALELEGPRAAVLQEPGFTAAHNTLGVVYYTRGDSAMSERVFRRALARTPADPMLMKNLVPVLDRLGKVAEARALAAQLAARDPEPPLYFFEAGITAMETGDFAAAKKLFARETTRSPFNHELHYWLGLAHMRLGETLAARKEMATALSYGSGAQDKRRYFAKLAHLRSLN